MPDHIVIERDCIVRLVLLLRRGWFAEAVWTLVGLVPAILAFTGVFICCRRVIFKKPSNSKSQSD